jgi:hypothetical protein
MFFLYKKTLGSIVNLVGRPSDASPIDRSQAGPSKNPRVKVQEPAVVHVVSLPPSSRSPSLRDQSHHPRGPLLCAMRTPEAQSFRGACIRGEFNQHEK